MKGSATLAMVWSSNCSTVAPIVHTVIIARWRTTSWTVSPGISATLSVFGALAARMLTTEVEGQIRSDFSRAGSRANATEPFRIRFGGIRLLATLSGAARDLRKAANGPIGTNDRFRDGSLCPGTARMGPYQPAGARTLYRRFPPGTVPAQRATQNPVPQFSHPCRECYQAERVCRGRLASRATLTGGANNPSVPPLTA